MNYSIIPLDVGRFKALPKSTCMYRMYPGVSYEAPCVMWYIRGSKSNVVVDLEPPGNEIAVRNHGLEMMKEANQNGREALRSIGVSPEEIKIVIMTHLHWDHCYGSGEFRNAKFIVQKSELTYAISPLPAHRAAYDVHVSDPPFFQFYRRMETVSGDEEIEPGIEVIHLPGHSPGSQGILVNTEGGMYLIAGDTVGLYENMEFSPPVPSGIFVNLEDYYATLKRIEKKAPHLLPGHDMKVFEKKCYP